MNAYSGVFSDGIIRFTDSSDVFVPVKSSPNLVGTAIFTSSLSFRFCFRGKLNTITIKNR